MKLFEEFKEYENMWTSNELHEDVNESSNNEETSKIFDAAVKKLDNFLYSIDGIDIDSYDDSYNNGKQLQWRYMWNIFEPITFNIDELEKQLKDLVVPMSTAEYQMSIYLDRDMLEDDGMLNICLSMT